MSIFLLDGGYFVKRFQKHRTSKSKGSMKWWHTQVKTGEVTEKEYKKNLKRIFYNDIKYLSLQMSKMGEVEKVIVCYDGIYGRRKRGEIFQDYKKNRSGIPPLKHTGIDICDKIKDCGVDPYNIDSKWEGTIDHEKEADDILAELCFHYIKEDQEVIIFSSDSDMYQLLCYDNVRIHNFSHEISREDVITKTGLHPCSYVEWKSLSGDSSDNIPGVLGIGKKRATNLLKKYNSIENIPPEYLKIYIPDDITQISHLLYEWRIKEGHSLNYCKKTYGTFWQNLERGKSPSISEIKLQPLLEIIDIKHLFNEIDYQPLVYKWKHIITLPFN